MDERLRRLAENDEIVRAVDPERVGEIHEFLCECTDLACRDILHLTPAEHRRVRETPGRFAVMPGHEDARVELVVEHHPRYRVVEKFGDAASVVRDLDPRRRS